MADPSLAAPLSELSRNYAKRSKKSVNISYNTAQAHADQIRNGGAADILITSRLSVLAELREEGVTDVYSQRTIATGQLALVAPADSTANIKFSDSAVPAQLLAASPELVLALIDPQKMNEGVATMEAMSNLGLGADLEPYYAFVADAGEVLNAIRRQKAYGITLFSDARLAKTSRILDMVPANSYTPIRYEGIVVGGENMNEARKLMTYLTSKEAKQIFANYGFAN